MDKEEPASARAGVRQKKMYLGAWMMKEQIHHHGESKRQATPKHAPFADALNHVQSAVMRESRHILLRIEPQDADCSGA